MGQSLVLPCEVSCDPSLDPTFKWFFNGKAIDFGRQEHLEMIGTVCVPRWNADELVNPIYSMYMHGAVFHIDSLRIPLTHLILQQNLDYKIIQYFLTTTSALCQRGIKYVLNTGCSQSNRVSHHWDCLIGGLEDLIEGQQHNSTVCF